MAEAQAHIDKIERKPLLTVNRNVFQTNKARKTKNSAATIVETYEISDSEEENSEPTATNIVNGPEHQVCSLFKSITNA